MERLRTRPQSRPGGNTTTDVVVVGAGPAGAVAARLLAGHGHDVILLDREAFPRPKACGDCLSAGATDLLARIGLLDRVVEAGPANLEGWKVFAPGGGVSAGSFRGATALAMERAVLDAVLVAAAVDEGVRFLQGRVEDVMRDPADGRIRGVRGRDPDGRPFRCAARLVIGADGLRSVVARRLGLVRRSARLRKVSLTTHLHLPGLNQRHGEMHVLEGGCVGFAPVGGGRFNLTLVVNRSRAGDLRRLGPHAFFRQWLARVPGLDHRIGEPDPHELLASGPFDFPVRSPAVAGAALVGDAAGYYDPFTGQGIYHGMAAAEILAAAAAPALAAGDLSRALRSYARRYRRLARPARRLQWLIETVLARPAAADLALTRLAGAPVVMDRLVAVTGDLRRPVSLISPALLSTLLLPTSTESR